MLKNNFILIVCLIIIGCTVKHERIKTYQIGDEDLSCEDLKVKKNNLL